MSFIVIWYDTWCGGLGDRICGLVSAIAMANLLGRKLLIKWDHPNIQGVFNLDQYNYYTNPIPLNPVHIITLDTIDNRFKY